MALYQVNYFSLVLARQVMVNVILPNDTLPMFRENNKHYQRETKVLFALHGYSENMNTWSVETRIQDMAIRYNLAIVMPSGENSFYLNQKGTGREYANFVGKELVDFIRKTFGLSTKKEDTFIVGTSMGGFGAIHTGLQFNNNFGKIAAFSSALIIHEIKNQEPGFSNQVADYDYFAQTFGDLFQLEDSDKNPEYLIKELKKKGETVPPIFMACGTEDFLLQNNRDFHEFLVKENVPVIYEEGPGNHDWNFWGGKIETAVQWFLDETI